MENNTSNTVTASTTTVSMSENQQAIPVSERLKMEREKRRAAAQEAKQPSNKKKTSKLSRSSSNKSKTEKKKSNAKQMESENSSSSSASTPVSSALESLALSATVVPVIVEDAKKSSSSSITTDGNSKASSIISSIKNKIIDNNSSLITTAPAQAAVSSFVAAVPTHIESSSYISVLKTAYDGIKEYSQSISSFFFYVLCYSADLISGSIVKLMLKINNVQTYVPDFFEEFVERDESLFNINTYALRKASDMSDDDEKVVGIREFFMSSDDDFKYLVASKEEDENTEESLEYSILSFLNTESIVSMKLSTQQKNSLFKGISSGINAAKAFVNNEYDIAKENCKNIKTISCSAQDIAVYEDLVSSMETFSSELSSQRISGDIYRFEEFNQNVRYYASKYNKIGVEDVILKFRSGLKLEKESLLKAGCDSKYAIYFLSKTSLIQDWYKIYIMFCIRDIMSISTINTATKMSIVDALTQHIILLHSDYYKIDLNIKNLDNVNG